jgi:F0F1-type ATP synthase assembly protein I
MTSEKDSDQPLSDLPSLAAWLTMGSTIVGCETTGVLLGLGADHFWRVAPAGLVIGIVLGTSSAVVSLLRQVRRYF